MKEVTYDLKKTIPEYPLLKWKDLRDGLLKVKMFECVSEELFFFAVFRKYIIDGTFLGYELYAYRETYSNLCDLYMDKRLHYSLRVIIRNRPGLLSISKRKEKEIIKDFYQKIDNEVEKFKTFLLKNELITQAEQIKNSEDVTYVVSDIGMSFTTKKAYKKITLAEGKALLAEVIKKADEFNISNGPHWYIDKLYLFGSVLKEKEMVGDVDLILKISFRPEYKVNIWRAAETQRAKMLGYKPDRYGIYSTRREPAKRLKISKYISITESLDIKILEEKSEPYKIVYSREEPA